MVVNESATDFNVDVVLNRILKVLDNPTASVRLSLKTSYLPSVHPSYSSMIVTTFLTMLLLASFCAELFMFPLLSD